MKRLQKLIRNGNSTMITLSPQMLGWLGWAPGQPVIVELTETKRVVVRLLEPDDLMPAHKTTITLDAAFPVVK